MFICFKPILYQYRYSGGATSSILWLQLDRSMALFYICRLEPHIYMERLKRSYLTKMVIWILIPNFLSQVSLEVYVVINEDNGL